MSINKFITNLDLARQAEIMSGETAVFQGGIELGIPFSGFPSGVDTSTIVSLGIVNSEFAAFSGNTGTTVFNVTDPSSPYYSVSATTLSASPYTIIDDNSITETVSATTYPTIMTFTALSGDCCSTPISVSFTPPIIQELYDRGLYDGLFNGLGQASIGTTYIDESFYNVGSVFSGANLNMEIVEYGAHGTTPAWVTGTTSGTVIEYSALTQYWTDPIYESLTSGLTLPITPESADTQTSGYIWTLTDSTIIDDNLVGLQYTGYSVTYSFDNVIIDPESPSITGGVTGATSADTYYLGTVTATLENFSAGTLDYKNSVTWLRVKGNAKVDERLTTDKLTLLNLDTGTSVTNLAIDGSGNVVAGSSTSGLTSYWTSGSSANTIKDIYGSHVLSGNYNVVAGGQNSVLTGTSWSFMGGGFNNNITDGTGINSIVGGTSNLIDNSQGASIIGGNGNEINTNSSYATILGGAVNLIGSGGTYTTILGGYNNTVDDSDFSSILAGQQNQSIDSDWSVIVGGYNNTIKDISDYSFIGGGEDNTISGHTHSYIIGGSGNTISYSPYDGDGEGIIGSTGSLVESSKNTLISTSKNSGIYSGQTSSIHSSVNSNIYNSNSNASPNGLNVIIGSEDSSISGTPGSSTQTKYNSIIGGNLIYSPSIKDSNNTTIIAGGGTVRNINMGGIFGGNGIVSGSTDVFWSTAIGARNAEIYDGNASSILAGDANYLNNSTGSVIVGGDSHTMESSDNSIIIGGVTNVMNNTLRSVILGGQNITATTNDTVYMNNLYVTQPGEGNFYSDLDNSAGALVLLSGGTDGLIRFATTTSLSDGVAFGMRGATEASSPGYGNQGDGYVYSSINNNGLNLISAPGFGTGDYIRFYAGQDANGSTADMFIQGTGTTRGNVGIGTETPTEKLDVNGNVKISNNLIVDGGITTSTIPSYADDAAAGVGGLSAGEVYQTDGTGASPLNVAGILMLKQ